MGGPGLLLVLLGFPSDLLAVSPNTKEQKNGNNNYNELSKSERTYPCDKVFAVFGHGDVVALRVGEVDSLLLNQLVHLRVILCASIEGRESDNHFVGQNAQCPPINWEGVAAFDQNLWS